MKKIYILLLVMLYLFLLVACNGNDDIVPEGEYALTVEDKYNSLYEPLKKSYKPGETVLVKTHLVMDVATIVELNGEKSIKIRTVQDENGHYIYNEYEFVMPQKASVLKIYHKEGMGVGYNVTLNDNYGCVINNVSGMKMAGETYEIHSNIYELDILINGEAFVTNGNYVDTDGAGDTVLNNKGEVLYYSWSFEMMSEDITITVSEH